MTKPPKRSQPSTHDAVPADSEPQQQLVNADTSTLSGTQAAEAETVEVELADARPVARERKRSAPVTLEVPVPVIDEGTSTPPEDIAQDEGDATMEYPVPRARPRRTTLAMAITRPPSSPIAKEPDENEPAPPTDSSQPFGSPASSGIRRVPKIDTAQPMVSDPVIPDELEDEVDEWSIADQPTVYLSPRLLSRAPTQIRQSTPPPWSRPASRPTTTPLSDRFARERNRMPASGTTAKRPVPGATPPIEKPRERPAPLRDPRMERFQYLREERIAHDDGVRGPGDARPIADMVRQWWRDLRPNLNSALAYQREARETGSHPIPAYVPAPGSRLGDAFGRLAATAREVTGRAQSVMAPRITRLQELHAQAETAASALVQKLEPPESRQQAPLLGPGRIAVFFKQGVTIGQAQSLLSATRARPIRLIPRKHGFLALVAPGTESDISVRLREHPYVRDVSYLEYNEYGESVIPR